MFLEFASLGRLWWALLAIPIVLLFILRVRLRRQQVATLLFWDQLFEENPPRAWWRRLRNWIALALQLVFLSLLVGALADPLWSWQKRNARQLVYVIDNSASMSACNAGETRTRLDHVRTIVRRMIASLRPHDTAAIVTAGGLPQVIVGKTTDVRILAETVDSIMATDNPTRLSAAVQLARRLVADEAKHEIIVLTDGADDAVNMLKNEADVTLYGFGKETGNTAITLFQVRRSIADATSYQVLVEATYFGDETVECRLDLELEGNVVDVIPLTLASGKPWHRTLDYTSPDGGRLVAKLDVEDALATDNQAIAILPRREPIPVLLVTPGSLFLRSVLESIPNVALTIADTLPAHVTPGTILVVHKTKLETIPAGPVIVVDPQSDSDCWTLGEDMAQPLVARQAADSPLLAHVRLQNVVLTGAKTLHFRGKVVPLLESPTDTSLYTRVLRTGGDVLVLSVRLADGDLPLRIAFPVMMKNAIESFLRDRGELRPALTTGQITSVHFGAAQQPPMETSAGEADGEREGIGRLAKQELRQLVLRSPDGQSEPVSAASGIANLGPFDHVGLWLLGPKSLEKQPEPDWMSREIVPIAVNLSNPAESDLRPRGELMAAPQWSVVWRGHSLWFYLSLCTVIGTCIEWFLYQRRIVA